MKKSEADQLERLIGQVDALYREISAAGKKSSTDAVNIFKLRFINSILASANGVLAKARPLAGFEKFEEDAIPSNSDVTFILAQYAEALDLVRSRSIQHDDFYGWHYQLSDSTENMPTSPPGSLKRGR